MSQETMTTLISKLGGHFFHSLITLVLDSFEYLIISQYIHISTHYVSKLKLILCQLHLNKYGEKIKTRMLKKKTEATSFFTE